MNDFLNDNEQINEVPSEEKNPQTETEDVFEEEAFEEEAIEEEDEEYISAPAFEDYEKSFAPISYSEVKPMNDYKPMSMGIKVFSMVMAFIIAISGATLAGYFIGKNQDTSYSIGNVSVPEIDLAARPKDTDEMTSAQVYEKVDKSVVGVTAYNSDGEGSVASGIIYSKDGYIVTNDHIYSEVPSAKFKIYTNDGKEYNAKYVAGDKVSDLAVLKIDGKKDFTPAIFGDSDELYSGQSVVAIGKPDGSQLESSITDGIVSAPNRRVKNDANYLARLIQVDCAVNPGSSGGALSDKYGHIVGITCSKLVGNVYDNVGYAIPTTIMEMVVKELIKEGKVVSRAKLGITYTAIDSVSAEINGYKNTGMLIASVSEDSGLYGLAQKDDIITEINSQPVTSDEVVLDILEKLKAGDTVSITVVTPSSGSKTVKVKLGANIGESSYTTEKKSSIEQGNGGTFDFPLD